MGNSSKSSLMPIQLDFQKKEIFFSVAPQGARQLQRLLGILMRGWGYSRRMLFRRVRRRLFMILFMVIIGLYLAGVRWFLGNLTMMPMRVAGVLSAPMAFTVPMFSVAASCMPLGFTDQ
jgi:hypothetical protein